MFPLRGGASRLHKILVWIKDIPTFWGQAAVPGASRSGKELYVTRCCLRTHHKQLCSQEVPFLDSKDKRGSQRVQEHLAALFPFCSTGKVLFGVVT